MRFLMLYQEAVEMVTVVTVTEVTVFSGGGTRTFGVLSDCK